MSAPPARRRKSRLPQSTPSTGPPIRATAWATRKARAGPRIWSNRIRIARPAKTRTCSPSISTSIGSHCQPGRARSSRAWTSGSCGLRSSHRSPSSGGEPGSPRLWGHLPEAYPAILQDYGQPSPVRTKGGDRVCPPSVQTAAGLPIPRQISPEIPPHPFLPDLDDQPSSIGRGDQRSGPSSQWKLFPKHASRHLHPPAAPPGFHQLRCVFRLRGYAQGQQSLIIRMKSQSHHVHLPEPILGSPPQIRRTDQPSTGRFPYPQRSLIHRRARAVLGTAGGHPSSVRGKGQRLDRVGSSLRPPLPALPVHFPHPYGPILGPHGPPRTIRSHCQTVDSPWTRGNFPRPERPEIPNPPLAGLFPP
jgi:hypothetical protein